MADDSPEWDAVVAAAAAHRTAGAARSRLGGYLPVSHPDHPSKWSVERRAALANAEAQLAEATEALRLAVEAHATLGAQQP